MKQIACPGDLEFETMLFKIKHQPFEAFVSPPNIVGSSHTVYGNTFIELVQEMATGISDLGKTVGEVYVNLRNHVRECNPCTSRYLGTG